MADDTVISRGSLIISAVPDDFEDDETLAPIENPWIMDPISELEYILTILYTGVWGLPSILISQLLAIFTIFLGAGALGLLVTRKKLPDDPESRPMIVYNAIKENPGMTMAQLQKLTGIPRGSINYTIHRLSLAGKIKKTTDSGAGNYYPVNVQVAGHEEFMHKVLTEERPNKIFQTIIDHPGVSQKILVEKTGIPQTTLQWHLSQLAKYNAIESVRNKNTVHYTAISDYVLLYNQLVGTKKQEIETKNNENVDKISGETTKKNTDNTNES
ncbi:winged helix-turn-helix transcriptional regulator [Methanorbis rubei]